MTPNQGLPATSQASEELGPSRALKQLTAEVEICYESDAVKGPKHDNAQDISEPTTKGHAISPTLAFDKNAIAYEDNQVFYNAQKGAENHRETDKQQPSHVLEKKYVPTTTEKGGESILRPIDRLVAAKKSRKTTRKVVECARLFRSTDYHAKFLPEQKIYELVDPKAVSLELKRSRKGPLGTQTPEKFCKILAILYLLNLPTKIRLFVLSGVCDEHLPFEIPPGVKRSDGTTALRSVKDETASLVFFKRLGDAEDFVKNQWSVLAHFFHPPKDTQILHDILHDDEILPFCSLKPTVRQGVSGNVFQAYIHPGHHCWDWNKEKDGKKNITCNTFAIKTLRSRDRCSFNKEVRVLRKLSKERHQHPHLITLLASYERRQTFTLIFPWAKADLFGFWEQEVNPSKTAIMARWIAEQCKGLAEALSRIHRWQTFSGSSIISEEEYPSNIGYSADEIAPKHDTSTTGQEPRNYFGVHGDLKPENMLWYPDPSQRFGILKITDFGIATFSKHYSRPGVMPNSPSYRSPEFEVEESHSPACDVWALGCIYLEFTTWFCGGKELLKDFGENRLEYDEKLDGIKSDKFFAIYYSPEEPGMKRAKVKDSVAKLIEELLTHATCLEFKHFQELLTIVRDEMLVVRPTHPEAQNRAENHSPLQRPQFGSELTRRKSSGQVTDSLSSMSVFAYDAVETSRQNTMDFNTSSLDSSTIQSIPGILQAIRSSPHSPGT